jgi:hypothetical protein
MLNLVDGMRSVDNEVVIKSAIGAFNIAHKIGRGLLEGLSPDEEWGVVSRL